MKAAIYPRYGSPDVIEVKDLPTPKPGPNQLLVKVHATTVNRTDAARLSAKPFIMRFFTGLRRPKEPILGTDFAGTVEALGSQADRFPARSRIFGFHDGGLRSQAEYLVVDQGKPLALIPDPFDFEQAVTLCEGAHYAINFLNKVDLTPGQKVLINGATGAIGTAAVQLLAQQDVTITAVCAGKHGTLVKSLGAQRVIDYETHDFRQDPERYDLIFDTVGNRTFGQCKHMLNPKGAYLSSELGPWCQNIPLALLTPLFRGRRVKFPMPVDTQTSLTQMRDLASAGGYQAVIDQTFDLDQIAQAYHYVIAGMKTGNVVVKP